MSEVALITVSRFLWLTSTIPLISSLAPAGTWTGTVKFPLFTFSNKTLRLSSSNGSDPCDDE